MSAQNSPLVIEGSSSQETGLPISDTAELLSRQELVMQLQEANRKVRALTQEVSQWINKFSQLRRELKKNKKNKKKAEADPSEGADESGVGSSEEKVSLGEEKDLGEEVALDEEETSNGADTERSALGSSLDGNAEALSDAGAVGDIEMQAQEEAGPQEEGRAEWKLTNKTGVVSAKHGVGLNKEVNVDEEDMEHSTRGSLLDGSPEVPSDGGSGDIEMQAQQEAVHHKVRSLERLDEVKGKMKRGDTVEIDNLVMELVKKNGLADMDKVHKVADFLKAANDGDVAVTVLHLSWNYLGVEGMQVLASHLPKGLTELGLRGTHLGVEGMKVLAPHLPEGLKDLRLMRNKLGVKGMEVLAPHLPKGLTNLDLTYNKLGVKGMEVLAPQLPKGLMNLHLEENNLGEKGLEVLAPHLPEGLKELGLASNKLGDEGMEVLAPHLPKKLKKLDLACNKLGMAGMKDHAPHLLKGLTKLKLNGNGLGERLLRFFLREGLLVSNLVIKGVVNSKTDPMIHEGMNQGWEVLFHLPYLRYSFKALMLQFGAQAAVVRWVVVLSCIVAFFLPVLFSREGYGSDGDDDGDEARVGDDSNQSSSSFIAVSLGEVCGGNTEALGDLFVDPVSGQMMVGVFAVMFVVFQVFAGPLKNLAVIITKSLFSCKSCSDTKDMFLGKSDDKVDEAKPTLDSGIDCALSKVQRSFFLFVHLLLLFFVLGDVLVWSNPVPFDSVLCRSALITSIIFYKPFIVSTFYCLNYLSDTTGWMLWHNPLTDSIVAVLLVLLLLWAVVAFTFSLPLLVCFFFVPMVFFLPPLAFVKYASNKLTIFKPYFYPDGTETEKECAEAAAFVLILKRLFFYSFFACVVFGVSLYPFYDGDGYMETAERVHTAVLSSLSLWSPEFALSFSWPRVSLPSQIGLTLSIGTISLEYLLLAWQVGLAYMYPLGFAFDGMYDKEPALHKAAREGSTDVVKALVDAKAKLDLVGKDGKSALLWAAEEGHAEVVKVLVDAKAKLDLVGKDGKSALLWAAEEGHAEAVKVLVDAKAKLDLVDKDGKSALLWAAEEGHAEVVKVLVDAKAKLDLVDKNGKSALLWAAQKGSAEMVKVLVDAKAKLDLVDKSGKTTHEVATENAEGEWEEVVKLFDAHATAEGRAVELGAPEDALRLFEEI